ncbi:MAG: hypothetical protein H3C44_10600 [Ignavibacteria bacterium]|nr:hypothetical protein [Ignavibacteria bacterium]
MSQRLNSLINGGIDSFLSFAMEVLLCSDLLFVTVFFKLSIIPSTSF